MEQIPCYRFQIFCKIHLFPDPVFIVQIYFGCNVPGSRGIVTPITAHVPVDPSEIPIAQKDKDAGSVTYHRMGMIYHRHVDIRIHKKVSPHQSACLSGQGDTVEICQSKPLFKPDPRQKLILLLSAFLVHNGDPVGTSDKFPMSV